MQRLPCYIVHLRLHAPALSMPTTADQLTGNTAPQCQCRTNAVISVHPEGRVSEIQPIKETQLNDA